MNTQEFHFEMHNYINRLSADFVAKQKLVQGGLDELHRICEKNKIEYQLAFGSLLGIIRDNGQIPWDYDIDVFVKFRDRAALITVLLNELSDDYYLDCVETDPLCESYKLRIVPKGFDPMVLHVDIFLLVPGPNTDKRYKKCASKLMFYSKIRRYKTGKVRTSKSRAKRLETKLYQIMYAPIPLRLIDSMYFNIVKRMESNTKSSYYMMSDRYADTVKIEKSIIDNTFLFSNGDGEYRIPKDYESLLNGTYGDYKMYFDISSRFEEWYHSCQKIGLTGG